MTDYTNIRQMMMSAGHSRRHGRLSVASLDREAHERTCGYWYTVTEGAVSHTAFATREGLDRWMVERNLHLERELPALGEFGTSAIIGGYRECSHLDVDEFTALNPMIATAIMSNGDYTVGLITEDDDGLRTVHYLNVNVPRVRFDYFRTRELVS